MGNILIKKARFISPKCNRPVYHLEACRRHKCKTFKCLRIKFRNKMHCSRHCCFAADCKMEATHHFGKDIGIIRLCSNHICSYTGYPHVQCHCINLTDTMYCRFHVCVKGCGNPTVNNNSKYCYNHDVMYGEDINEDVKNTPLTILTVITDTNVSMVNTTTKNITDNMDNNDREKPDDYGHLPSRLQQSD